MRTGRRPLAAGTAASFPAAGPRFERREVRVMALADRPTHLSGEGLE